MNNNNKNNKLELRTLHMLEKYQRFIPNKKMFAKN